MRPQMLVDYGLRYYNPNKKDPEEENSTQDDEDDISMKDGEEENSMQDESSIQDKKDEHSMKDIGGPGSTEEPWEPPPTFQTIPGEIRDLIYKVALLMPGPIYVPGNSQPYAWKEGPIADPTSEIPSADEWSPRFDFPRCSWMLRAIVAQADACALLGTSKTIYREAASMYYGKNAFKFYDVDAFNKFADTLGPDARWQVATISMQWMGKGPSAAAKLLTTFPRLSHLELDIKHCYTFKKAPMYDTDVLKIYGLNDLLKIRGVKSLQVNIPEEFIAKAGGDQEYICDDVQTAKFLSMLEIMKGPRDVKAWERLQKIDFKGRIGEKPRRIEFGIYVVLTNEQRKEWGYKERKFNVMNKDGKVRPSVHSTF